MFSLQFLILLLGISLGAARNGPFFRKDYKYFAEFDAFYKLHENTTGGAYIDAFLACNDEGSQIFYPLTTEEKSVAKQLIEYSNKTDVTEIFVGIHDEFNIGEFVTVDGSHSPFPSLDGIPSSGQESRCVAMDAETGKFSIDTCSNWRRPFVCKKVVERKPCNTVDTGYIYSKDTGKCYKVSNRRRTWDDAFKTCYMEGASLVVIRNRDEYDNIVSLIHNTGPWVTPPVCFAPVVEAPDTVEERYENEIIYYLGIRQWEHSGHYITVKGDLLNGGAYQPWESCSNNFNDENGINNCLSMYKDGDRFCYKSSSCYTKTRFICEMPAYSDF